MHEQGKGGSNGNDRRGPGARPRIARQQPERGDEPEKPRSLLPALSLPRGGGAIRGIGEKFEANNATGTGSLSVPISTSPGRGGFDLELAVSYASGAGNGPFGLGWGLAVPQITRKTDKGLPRYQREPDSDLFLLSGAEDLVPVRQSGVLDSDVRTEGEASYRVQRYRPRVEGLFARIERWTDRKSGDVHWRATTRDNITSIYGMGAGARISDRDDPNRVFSWLLSETRDDRGNIVRYSYKAEDGAGVSPGLLSEQSRFDGSASAKTFVATAQRYLKRIEYGNREPGNASSFHFEVVFDYGEHDAEAPSPDEAQPWSVRLDPFSDYRPGFEVRTYRLCRRVLMFHRFEELGPEPQLVRSTDFGYREGPVLTYLESITHAGYEPDGSGGYVRKALPSLECGYLLPELHDRLETIDPASLEGIPGGIEGLRSQWVDLDGEGVPGVLTATEGAWFYKQNLGAGRLAHPVRQETLPRPAELAGGTQQLTDLGGDGNLDLVQYTPPLAGYFERTRGESWRPFVSLPNVPRINWNDPNLRFLDLDGDGHPDVLITEHDAFVWYRSRTKEGFESATHLPKPRDERDGPTVLFADDTEAIGLADMSGDGLVDIVRVRSSQVCYWPNLGHGRFGRRITMAQSPRLDAPDRFDPTRVRFADIDGSGTSDILYLGAQAVTVFLNQSGNGFAEGVPIRSLPPISGANVTVVDLLGQGTACLVWSSAQPGDHSRPLAYVDLMGGKKPHLLSRIANNLGSETRISYAPSTRFYLQDKAAGRPWLTRLPFPVQVIERIERFDHVVKTKLVSTYRYHHGYYDGHERELRGFACVETLDAETLSGADELTLPPVLTRTWYHTGAWLEREHLERELAREYYRGDPNAPLLADTILPGGLSAREEREAARALRGQVLRSEVYALDEPAESEHPYAVSEQNHAVRLLQHAEGNDHAIFFVHPRETVTLHYERNPSDPRLQHELVLDVDDFGNVTRSAAISYPRRQPAEPEQAKLWAAVSEATFANEPTVEGPYHIGVPIKTRSHELTGLVAPAEGVFSLGDVRATIAGAVAIPYEAEPTSGAVELRCVEHERIYYYADDLSARLPLGQIGARAIPYETQTLAFTPSLLTQVFGNRIDDTIVGDEGRYVQDVDGWWAPAGRVIHDPDHFYLPVAAVDPFGQTSTLRYDDHHLLVAETEDALGNRITAANDYRVLAPALVTDPNQNRTAARFDALGMVVASAVMGKEGAGEGDTLSDPTIRIHYDLDRWRTSGLPAVVKTERREVHGDPGTRWQTTYGYSDGSGRAVMTKARAEPGPAPILDDDGHLVREADGTPATHHVTERWIGTGRTVFDNKGNPVKKYEPFFSSTFEYEDEDELVEWGVTPILRYDPLGRLIRTDHPDGTHERIEFDPWQQRSYDANDTVAGTPWLAARQAGTVAEQRAAALSVAHADTPVVAHFDSLGRPFLTIVDDGTRKLETRAELDIEGLTRRVIDARGIETLRQTFDVLGRAIGSESPDAGQVRMLPDVAGKPVRSFTARDHTLRYAYDELQRPTHLFSREPGATGEILTERTVYGESHPEAIERNLRGAPHLSFDGAGELEGLQLDFKGNVLSNRRRLARAYKESPDWSPLAALTDPAAIEAAAAPLLEAELFDTTAAYDALDRITARTTPDESVTVPAYNEAGLLETMAVRIRGAETATIFVDNIDYNARGQRTRVEHGNGAVCTYDYDPETFRLARQLLQRPGADPILQDLAYTYDAAGNLVQVSDAAPFGNAAVSADGLYEYDGIGQLVRAEGREHPGQQPTDADPELLRLDAPGDLQALRRYRQVYEYDEVGNIASMKHLALANGAGGWTRRYQYAPDNNRLLATSVPGDPDGQLSALYAYDAAGNMVTMPHLPLMRWDHANRLQATSRQSVTSGGTPETTYYTYDTAGQRVRKVTERQAAAGQPPARKQERVYLGGFEIFRSYQANGNSVELERESLHVVDGESRVAIAETRTQDSSVPDAVFEPVTRLRYQAANQIGSTTLELDETAQVITYEEYFPFGATAMHAGRSAPEVSRKRYRYTGKERDTETGFHYHGARYYAAWLGRWTSADPLGASGDPNAFAYALNRPLALVDPQGTQSRDREPQPRTADEDAPIWVAGETIEVTGKAPSLDRTWAGYSFRGIVAEVSRQRRFYTAEERVWLWRRFPHEARAAWAGYNRTSRRRRLLQRQREAREFLRYTNSALPFVFNTHPVTAALIQADRGITYLENKTCGHPGCSAFVPGPNAVKATVSGTAYLFRLLSSTRRGRVAAAESRVIGTATKTATGGRSRSYYVVQGEADAERLAAGGEPFPTAADRAHLGEGVYAWDSRETAESYLRVRQADFPEARLKIVELQIQEETLERFRTINLVGNDALAADFVAKHSRIFGEGVPHDYDYVIRATEIAAEHFFTKYVFPYFDVQH